MKKIMLIIWLVLVFTGCSSDDSNSSGSRDKIKLNIAGTDMDFNNDLPPHSIALARKYDNGYYSFGVGYGTGYGQGGFGIFFDKEGHIVSASCHSQSEQYGISADYAVCEFFPDHYFNLDVVSIGEERMKIKFSGKLYHDDRDLNSEAIDVNGEVDISYIKDETPLRFAIKYGGFELHCNANIDGLPWTALHQNEPHVSLPSIFTASDPYKIEIYFAPNNNDTATYNITPESTDNYIRLWKFNPDTFSYVGYKVTGTLDYHYREFHGAGAYTYFGNFSFTAVNPDNPADVIQVTDGDFISYQTH